MLTDQACRNARPADKPQKLFDGGGLFLLVTAKGFKSWRLKYRFGGKEKLLTIGAYPETSLRSARDRRDEARRLLREGIDPGEQRKAVMARRRWGIDEARTFEAIARLWHGRHCPGWKPKHAQDVIGSLENEIFPTLGRRDIGEIRGSEILQLLLAIQQRGAIETAHRIRARISSIYGMAIAADLVAADPAAKLSQALRPIGKRMFPALLKLDSAQTFLRTMEEQPADPTTKLASRLLALTAARPGMIRFAELREFEGLDTAEPVWRVPADKMKLLLDEASQEAFEFVIPLSRQAVDAVRVAVAYSTGRTYLFPSARHPRRPFSENALSTNYRRVPGFGGRHVPHGWRASFSTIMNQRALDQDRPGDRAVIDLMLAHKPAGVESRYNRAAYMDRRRQIAQEWADLLLKGFAPPDVLLSGPRR